MPRKQQTGGKIKSVKDINRDIKKAFSKQSMTKAGDYLKKNVVPALTSIAIPAVSALAGVGGEFVTGNPIGAMATEALTQRALEKVIPQKYQSQNKYIKLAGDLAGATTSGDVNPYDASSIIGHMTGHGINDDSTPYDPFINQILNQQQESPQIDYNALTDATYNNGDIAPNADRIKITSPPFQQREASTSGLLGAGIRKKRRTKKPVEVILKSQLPHHKFTHSANKALEQYLIASQEREQREMNKLMYDTAKKQQQYLKSLGY